MSITNRKPNGAYVLRANAGKDLQFIGSLKVSGESSGGAFELIEYAGPAAPPPHIHRSHDEAFYILQGSFTFVLGSDEVEADQGSVVFVPRGTRHGFKVSPGGRALFFTIPAGLEGFFEELGAGLAAGKTSEVIRNELAGKYDSTPTSG